MPSSYLIVGNGITGITAAEVLRAEDPASNITVVADDPFPVYYRPALKDYLAGHMPEEKLWARPNTFYQEQRVRFVPGRVQSINPQQHVIYLQTQQQLSYSKLLLAHGAIPRPLTCPGIEMRGVKYLRTVADYQEILQHLETSSRVVICGSGTLALESAEALNHSGFKVTHLLRNRQIWSEVLDQTSSDLVLQEERRAGIDVHLEENIKEVVGKNGRVSEVVTTKGTRIPCELVLVAIGIKPIIDFVQASGITCERGILVDSRMQTNAPDIYAAGDVIEVVDVYTGRKRVIGQWYPAIQQARTAALSMIGRVEQSEPEIFYNATFLHGLDFVSLGITPLPSYLPDASYREVIAEPGPRNYRKVLLQNGIPVGAVLLGERSDGLALKRAIDQKIDLSPIIDQLFTTDFDLMGWLDNQYPQQALQDTEIDPNAEYDAYIVPIMHPQVPIQIGETQVHEALNTMGRQPGSTVTIDHSSISRKHAELAWYNGHYYLCDMGSSNGTFVNSDKLTPSKPVILQARDIIRLGDARFRFELRPRKQAQEIKKATKRPSNMQGPMLATRKSEAIGATTMLASVKGPAQATMQLAAVNNMPEDQPCLVLVASETEPRVIPLEAGAQQSKRLSIGRDPENQIVLDDSATSRKHAEILYLLNEFYIRDLNSSNGVIVNKEKIHEVLRLHDRDRIVVGNTLIYCAFSAESRAAFTRTQAAPTQQLSMTRALIADAPELTNLVNLTHRSKIRPYSTERVRIEIDMCIGCDRCMTACPLPSSTKVFIADLNQATISDQIAPHVADFTHECIMCGSCVAVCPVDNHRDLLMLSLKQRLGASWDRPVTAEQLAAKLPPGWNVAEVVARLQEHALLENTDLVPEHYLFHLLLSSQLRQYTKGQIMVHEGEYGRDLYFVLEGQLSVLTTETDGKQLQLAILNRGEYAGEYSMLTGQPHQATIQALAPSVVMQVPEQVMQRLMELVPETKQYFERMNNARSIEGILRRMSLFQGVAEADLRELAAQTQIKQYERDERLFAETGQGAQPARETLHMLLEGFVKVARLTVAGTGRDRSDERVIAYRQGGDYFAGGLDLLGDGRSVTVTAINRTRVAEVPRYTLLTLFQRYPEVDQRFRMRLRDYIATSETVQSTMSVPTPTRALVNRENLHLDEQAHEGLHSLVKDGVVEGTEVLVIDLDKCIHCNECEEACERRHGHSRMNRKGMIVDNISIATACRQCQDPVCMLCSRAGIARHPNGEVYITESCIGCGICAERCPYGAISIVNIEKEQVEIPLGASQGSWQRFSNFFQKAPIKERARKTLPMVNGKTNVTAGPLGRGQVADPVEEMRKKIAIKCDLCAGYGDQACVQACPVGAAVRVQPTLFFGSTEDILRKRTV
jgi:NADPH-dependent 2,4-dienoyl-CoA reductase/sulfur reductase-like enzyme/pSer/pThr/pTyr-binding forkhead associated (FHA) protein/CRP-like cAMP-binding protein/Fe-S-cluster-containing hydrogenase component 2